MTEQPGLSPEQDGDLRRLTYLGRGSQLSSRVLARLRELRGRDRRASVRSPRPQDVAAPPQH